MQQLVSVIIPTYNRADTVKRAVESVLGQTYSNIEVIVVDDCSSDDTKKIIESISDDRVSFIRLETNSGACVARNKGVENASGEYIAFQDSDDFWHPDKLEKQVSFLEKGEYDFVTCGFYRISNSSRTEIGFHDCNIDPIKNWCELLDNNWVSTQTILCKKSCFEKISFDRSIKRYQDWDLALQAATCFKMGSLNEGLVDVYLQEDSITFNVKNYEAKLAVISKHEKDVLPSSNEMKAQYYKSLADVHRGKDARLARKEYLNSFKYKPRFKVLFCSLLCALGFFNHYKTRQ